jgi:hypothetical protein
MKDYLADLDPKDLENLAIGFLEKSGLNDIIDEDLAKRFFTIFVSHFLSMPDPIGRLVGLEFKIIERINLYNYKIAIPYLQQQPRDIQSLDKSNLEVYYNRYIEADLASLSKKAADIIEVIFRKFGKDLFELVVHKADEIKAWLELAIKQILLLLEAGKVKWMRLMIKESINMINEPIMKLEEQYRNILLSMKDVVSTSNINDTVFATNLFDRS